MSEITEHQAIAERLVESWVESCGEYSTTFPDDGDALMKQIATALTNLEADAHAAGRAEAVEIVRCELAQQGQDLGLGSAKTVQLQGCFPVNRSYLSSMKRGTIADGDDTQ